MAKLFATQMCTQVANQAVQIHGGCGVMKNSVHRFYRDCKIFEIGEEPPGHKNIITWQLGL
jgi:alkylation response protein AidB-like acyl-CoA dehydrogenase